jgi:hypothetical protein
MCSQPVDASGPGVASYHPNHDADKGWRSFWVPFIEDLRTNPTRLVHPACFASEVGVEALIEVVHQHDSQVRKDQHRQWRREQGLD